MASALILVNGLPGQDTSALAVKLAVLLDCPVLSMAAVAESLAVLTGKTVPDDVLEGIARDTVWRLAAAVPDGAVIDSDIDDLSARAGVATSGAGAVVELWCRSETPQVRDWPVVRVDTSVPVDFDLLLPELAAHLA